MAGSSQSQNHAAEPGAIITAPTLCKCTLLSKCERDEDGEVQETDETKAAGGHRKAAPSFPLKPADTRRSTCGEGRYKTLKTKLRIPRLWTSIFFFPPLQNSSADNCKMSHRFTGSAFIQIYKTFFQMYLQFKSPVVIFKGPRGLNVLARYSHQTASFID